MTTQTLIHGGAVLTVDDSFTIHDPGWVHIEGTRIVAVGAGAPEPDLVDGVDEVIDATGSAVMPGMTNAHTHLFQTFFRGLADDKALLDWLRECIWPGAQHLDPDAAYLAAKVGLIENLRGGATSVLDHQYVHVDPMIDDAVCRAADELGVRYLLARGWSDRNYPDRLQETPEETLARTAELRDRWHGHDDGRIRIETAPLLPWGCSDDAITAIVADARSWGAGCHIHCAETDEEVQLNLDERGVRHVEWLENLGLLGPDMQLAHSVWLDDGELDLIAARDAVVVHCPVSNMYLASGVARILDMRARGIRVALASDGPGSNNRQDMFEVLKATVLLQKVHHLDAMAMQPEDAITLACRGGSAATGIDDTGVLAAGALADVLVVSLGSVFTGPVHRVPSALVFCASPADVTHVLVGGRVVVDDGEVVGVDERALMAEAATAAGEVFARAGVESRLTRS